MEDRTNYTYYKKRKKNGHRLCKLIKTIIISLFGFHLSIFQKYQMNINLVSYFQKGTLAKNISGNMPGDCLKKNSIDLWI